MLPNCVPIAPLTFEWTSTTSTPRYIITIPRPNTVDWISFMFSTSSVWSNARLHHHYHIILIIHDDNFVCRKGIVKPFTQAHFIKHPRVMCKPSLLTWSPSLSIRHPGKESSKNNIMPSSCRASTLMARFPSFCLNSNSEWMVSSATVVNFNIQKTVFFNMHNFIRGPKLWRQIEEMLSFACSSLP